MRLSNPWVSLQGPTYIAGVDREAMQSPKIAKLKGKKALRLDIPPEPWCGPVHHAAVLVLSANPRWNDEDDKHYSPAHEAAMLDNLSGQEDLIWLRDEFLGSSGSEWYRKQLLGDILQHVPVAAVASKLALVDYFPYRSEQWKESVRTPSQDYTFQVVGEALQRGALIIITRSQKLWMQAVPTLAEKLGTQVFINSSPQQVRISSKNTRLPDQGVSNKFQATVNALS